MKNKDNSLYGLVLAGGKSKRMGQDKGLINWHGNSQRYFLYDLLSKFCDKVFISIRTDQKKEIKTGCRIIEDKFKDLTQFGAILSALSGYPKKSFLVIACDLPFIDERAISILIKNRDRKMIATAYRSGIDGLPEPLCAIWEPESRERLMELLKEGITCPRKALIKSFSQVKLVTPEFPELTLNTNTPEDLEKAERLIEQLNYE